MTPPRGWLSSELPKTVPRRRAMVQRRLSLTCCLFAHLRIAPRERTYTLEAEALAL